MAQQNDAELTVLMSLLNPYERVLSRLQSLFDLLRQVLSTVMEVYRSVRNDIHECWNGVTPEATTQQRETYQRVVVTLLNLTRFFNPAQFTVLEQQISDKDEPLNVLLQLVHNLNQVVGQVMARSRPLMQQVHPLVQRVNQVTPEYDERLWNELNEYHARVLSFVLEVLNPALFSNTDAAPTAGAQL